MENPTMGTHDQDTSEVKFDRPIEGERSDGWILKYEPGSNTATTRPLR
jgi:hypothetical protein